MNPGTKRLLTGAILLIAACSAILIAKYATAAPLFYVGLLSFLLCLFLSFELRKSNSWKLFFFNLAIVALFLGLAEAYFTWFAAPVPRAGAIQIREEYLQGRDYYVADATRGYAGGPNVKKRVRKSLGEKVLYDVTYTTNGLGLRVAPHDAATRDRERGGFGTTVAFFGDSFTFGEGLNDNESLPYLFEELAGGRYQAWNFGFHGYGAQQMLRIIETGLLEKAVPDQQPMIVVYEALLQHIERMTGKMIWDAKVPRYKLSAAGTAEYAGTFVDDPDLKENLKHTKELSNPKSQLLARVMGEHRTQEDIKLYVQIVLQAKQLVEKRHRAQFHVLLWPLGDKDTGKVVEELGKVGIDVITVDQVFKEYQDPLEKYMIEVDNHPTRLANERIAKYLLEHIK